MREWHNFILVSYYKINYLNYLKVSEFETFSPSGCIIHCYFMEEILIVLLNILKKRSRIRYQIYEFEEWVDSVCQF
jgi:hypothetical protein